MQKQYLHCIYGPKLETSPTISLYGMRWLSGWSFWGLFFYIFLKTNAYTNLRCDINSFTCWVFRVIVLQNWQADLKLSVGTCLGWYQRWRLALAAVFPRAGAVIFTARCGHTLARGIVAGSTGARPIPATLAGVTARLALASALLSVLAAHAFCIRHDEFDQLRLSKTR